MVGTCVVDIIDKTAVGIRLCWVNKKEELLLFDTVYFKGKHAGVCRELSICSISGSLDVGAKLETYFADIINDDGDIVNNVALDRGSFRTLKNRLKPTRDRQEE